MGATCVLCAAPAPRRFTSRGHAVHRCGVCDLEFVWPAPPREVLEGVYATGYFAGDGHGYTDYLGRERAIAVGKATARLDALAALGMTTGRLLDVGCAAGFFMEAARGRGFTVHGVEPSAEARASLRADLQGTVTATLPESPGAAPYDVVTLWDVLEHLPDPPALLGAVRALARPGAVVAVVLPVIGNVNTRWVPGTWDQYKPPEHLWYFSRAAVRTLLARELGADIVREDIAWQRPGRWYDPEGLQRGTLPRALRALDRAAGNVLAAVLGPSATVDSVALYARLR